MLEFIRKIFVRDLELKQETARREKQLATNLATRRRRGQPMDPVHVDQGSPLSGTSQRFEKRRNGYVSLTPPPLSRSPVPLPPPPPPKPRKVRR